MANDRFRNGVKVAFTVHFPKDPFFVNDGDVKVMERNPSGDPLFLETASFRTTSQALEYLNGKYPD